MVNISEKDKKSAPWKHFKLNSEEGLFKYLVTDTEYIFLYFDYTNMFEAGDTIDYAKQMCAQLNDGLEMNDKKLMEQIEKALNGIEDGSSKVEITRRENQDFYINLECPLMADMTFKWELLCNNKLYSTTDSSDVADHFSLPMLSYVCNLRTTINSLFTELARKDKEIKDFRFQGYSLRQKQLKTAKFSEEEWKAKIASPDWIKQNLKSFDMEKLLKDDVYRQSLPVIVEILENQDRGVSSLSRSNYNPKNYNNQKSETKSNIKSEATSSTASISTLLAPSETKSKIKSEIKSEVKPELKLESKSPNIEPSHVIPSYKASKEKKPKLSL